MKFADFEACPDVVEIMEAFLERFPQVFEGFDVVEVEVILTKKRTSRVPITLKAVGCPCYLFMKPYVMEVHEDWWKDMDTKKRNLAVFHVMCQFPEGAFDEQSKNYGRKLKPPIQMFMEEFAAAGGIPNWMENPAAADPLEATDDGDDEDAIPDDGEGDGVERKPVTAETIATVGTPEGAAEAAG